MTLAAGPLLGQVPAAKTEAGAYLVPFDTKGNRIELTVANETERAYEEVEVRTGEVPVWVEIHPVPTLSGSGSRGTEPPAMLNPVQHDVSPGDAALFTLSSPLHARATRGFAFTFSTDDSAPTEEVHTLSFDVYSGEDLVATKQIDISVELPKELVLRGNYPNPFNPSTTIGFVQPEDGDVALEIFDGLGRRLERLSKPGLKRGQQTIRWNATAHASGVYFYRLQLRSDDGLKETRLGKMMLVK